MNQNRQIFIKPVAGRRMLKPGTRDLLDAAGELVEYSPTWLRRLNDGDVIEVTPTKTKPAPPAKSPQE